MLSILHFFLYFCKRNNKKTLNKSDLYLFIELLKVRNIINKNE